MAIRLEWTPIKNYGLGILGFDHLLLTYQQDAGIPQQDGWWVIEGAFTGSILSVVGEEGRTTLSEANDGRTGQALIDWIGTTQSRGGRTIAVLDELASWDSMATYAADIDGQFAYSVLGIAGTARPTSNSTSVIASLLYYLDIDIMTVLPLGLRRTSGLHTLLGTQSDDELETTDTFTTIQSGMGADTITGTVTASIEDSTVQETAPRSISSEITMTS
mgnify:CR=1 FL=1